MRRVVSKDTTSALFINRFVMPKKGDKILDIGCGPGNLLNDLIDVEYTGLDINDAYIRSAQSRYGEKGTFICGKVSEDAVEGEDRFDIVIALGLLHHLDDHEAAVLFRLSRRVLKPGGRLITFDGCYVPHQSALARWFLSMDRGRFVRTEDQYLKLASGSFSNLKSSLHHDFLRIPYTILIMECTKT